MNEIKVGEYVRTEDGTIFKATEYWVSENAIEYAAFPDKYTITKHSPNIIDIIERRRLC